MRDLNYELKQLCHRNRDGSFTTQANRETILRQVADQLHELGYRNMKVASLKPRHVEALVARWKSESLSPGTLKNRLAHIRWWAEKVGKPGVVALGNAAYGIERRQLVTGLNKARELTSTDLARVTDVHTRLSLRLQAAFGLRREESIKIQPTLADRGDRLVLRATWCKGGREREVPVRTDAQRQLLEEAKALAGKGSLIPAGLRYVDQLRRFEHQCRAAGIHHVHGHRHAYAQERYRELTGWNAPAAGGPRTSVLTPAQREADRVARLVISQDLGHCRLQVVSVYLAR